MRADNDKEHTLFLHKLMNSEQITTNDFLDNFKLFSPKDISTLDHQWINASLLVTTNRERFDIIGVQSQKLARVHNTYVFTWACQTSCWVQKPNNEFLAAAMADPALTEFFIAGVEAYITMNLNKKIKITNVTRVQYHSITPATEEQQQFIEQQMLLKPIGSKIQLSEPPFSIKVEFIDIKQEDHLSWMGLSICTDKIVIPILPRKGKWSQPIPS